MNPIEVYDIITLNNKEEYTVIKILNESGKKYYLLSKVNEEEEPDLENIKIVEEITENGKIKLKEVKDEEHLKKLSIQFLNSLKKGLD